MYMYDTTIRVRYNETDRMGYLHHGYYPIYFEIARTEMLRSVGTTYRLMEDNGIVMPVYSLRVDYKLPAFYDELLTIRSVITELPVIRLNIEYEVYNEMEIMICTGATTNVFVNGKTRKPIRATEEILERFAEYFN